MAMLRVIQVLELVPPVFLVLLIPSSSNVPSIGLILTALQGTILMCYYQLHNLLILIVLKFRSGTTGSRGSRRSETTTDLEESGEQVMIRMKPVAERSISAVSNGTAILDDTVSNIGSDTASTTAPEPRRAPRTKEEIELSNLRKKTRKRTRRFEVDGVVVTTTTSKVS